VAPFQFAALDVVVRGEDVCAGLVNYPVIGRGAGAGLGRRAEAVQRAQLVQRVESQLGGAPSGEVQALWYGLREALPSTVPPPCIAPSPASLATTSSSVRAQAVCVLHALRKAADARFVLMGWADDDWRAASTRAEQHEIALMQANQQGNA
jgi:hypothetical protein